MARRGAGHPLHGTGFWKGRLQGCHTGHQSPLTPKIGSQIRMTSPTVGQSVLPRGHGACATLNLGEGRLGWWPARQSVVDWPW